MWSLIHAEISVIHKGVKQFLNEKVKKSCFPVELSMLKHIQYFQCSVDTRNRINMKKYRKKVFWCSVLFQSNLANLQPVTPQISTAGKLSSGGQQTTFTVNHEPQSNLYEEFKGFVEVTLYNINKWGCTLGWMSLDADKIANTKDHKKNRNLQILILHEGRFICWYISFMNNHV